MGPLKGSLSLRQSLRGQGSSLHLWLCSMGVKRRDWDGDPVSSAASGKGDSERSRINVVRPRREASDGAGKSSACPRCCVLPDMGLSVPLERAAKAPRHDVHWESPSRTTSFLNHPQSCTYSRCSPEHLGSRLGSCLSCLQHCRRLRNTNCRQFLCSGVFLTRFLPGRPGGPSNAGLRGAPSFGWQSAGALARAEQRNQGDPGPMANNLSDAGGRFLLQLESGT